MTLVFVAAVVSDYHDGNILHRNVSMHNHAAPLMVGLAFVFVLLLNALAFRLHPGLALRKGELAVALALALAGSPIPRYFAPNLVGTVGHTKALLESKHGSVRDLQKANPYAVLPDAAMLTTEQSLVYDGAISEKVGHPAPLWGPGGVPWSDWVRPMTFWAPLVLVFLAFSVSFGYVLCRQWAERELLCFPLAEFVGSLAERRSSRAWPDVFYNGLFWAGLALMLVLFGAAGLNAHFEKMVFIPVKFAYYDLAEKFSFLNDSLEGYSLLRGWLFFTVIAVAYLLPSEISFTSWFTWPIMVTCTYFYFARTGQRYGNPQNTTLLIGAWWGMALLILYGGRRYYWGVLKAALGAARPDGEIDRQSVWVARVFLASAAALVALLCVYGLPLDVAVLWTVGLSVMFLVVCRLVAEMGIPWTPLAGFGPLAVLLHILGSSALGAKVYSLMAVLNSVLLPERTSVLLMAPAVTNAARVESRVLGRNPCLKVIGPFLLAVLVFSAAALIWLGYSHEGSGDDRHSFRVVTDAAKAVGTMIEDRAGKGARGADADRWINEDLPFAARWAAARPTEGFSLWLLALGFGMVVATGYLRLKLPKFPLHPLPLVLLGTWLMSRYWMCFLIGWGLKQLVLRIGGGRLFEKGRPFFTGMVIGQAVVLLVWVIVNIILFWKNGLVFDRNWWTFMTWMYSG